MTPKFNEWKESEGHKCHNCGSTRIEYRTWESDDGAFEDEQWRCLQCKYSWWVEGGDA